MSFNELAERKYQREQDRLERLGAIADQYAPVIVEEILTDPAVLCAYLEDTEISENVAHLMSLMVSFSPEAKNAPHHSATVMVYEELLRLRKNLSAMLLECDDVKQKAMEWAKE